MMKKLALVLGGGAAKGFAHIGVLKVLNEYNIKPDLIVGTSMGAVVGGAYAKGIGIDKLEEMSTSFSMRRIRDISIKSMLKKGCLMRGVKLKKYVKNLLGDTKHEELKIPFIAVATEIATGKQKNLKSGLVWQNVLASSAMPAVFPMIEIDGKTLCDGGIMDNLPIDVARKYMKNAIILSIDVIGDYPKQVEQKGIKLMTQIINMSTLYMTQLVDTSLSDLNVKITQPEIQQMDFSKKATKQAIINGQNAMRKNIAKLQALLDA